MARCSVSRRTVLGGCVLTSGYLRSAHADEPVDPARLQLPQPGDRLVEAGNDSGSAPLKPVDIDSQNPLLAWAFDPRKKLVRDGSRLNMVLLMRFDAAALSAAEKATAPDGVVAYSAVCTQAHPLTDRRRGSDGSRAGEAWAGPLQGWPTAAEQLRWIRGGADRRRAAQRHRTQLISVYRQSPAIVDSTIEALITRPGCADGLDRRFR